MKKKDVGEVQRHNYTVYPCQVIRMVGSYSFKSNNNSAEGAWKVYPHSVDYQRQLTKNDTIFKNLTKFGQSEHKTVKDGVTTWTTDIKF